MEQLRFHFDNYLTPDCEFHIPAVDMKDTNDKTHQITEEGTKKLKDMNLGELFFASQHISEQNQLLGQTLYWLHEHLKPELLWNRLELEHSETFHKLLLKPDKTEHQDTYKAVRFLTS